mgnify:CR=1 FL=1
MSLQDQISDFILNSLKRYDLDPSLLNTSLIPDIMDLWQQNFHYALGPTNPAFIGAILSSMDLLVGGYTLQYNSNGVLWRVDPAGRPHPDDYNKFLEQNRVIQKATERTIEEVSLFSIFHKLHRLRVNPNLT